MVKNIQRLAKIGEKELNRRMENYVRSVYIEYLPQERENRVEIACGMNLGLYLERRREFIDYGLDPSQYDNQIKTCLKELDIETETLDRIIERQSASEMPAHSF